jgi:hypothetical protein
VSTQADRLYDLLPAVYRERDASLGFPLQALLQVISEQVEVVQEDIVQLYDNWFIETCQEWVVPYIAELVGYRTVHDAGEPGSVATAQGRLRNRFLVPRREVANTIRFRRRKGSLQVLAQLSEAVAGWAALPVEFFRLLAVDQSINHVHLDRGRTASLRSSLQLERLNGPFDRAAHAMEVRRPNSHRARGRYNVPSVGVYVWRLKPHSVTRTPAFCREEEGPQCYTFSVLGHDSPLFNRPSPEQAQTPMAGVVDLPGRIRRRELDAHKGAYYGQPNGFQIWTGPDKRPVDIAAIVVADLSGWRYRARRGTVAVDPELGRIVFPTGALPKRGVWVAYNYGFADDIGGGEYPRTLSQPPDAVVYRVGEGLRLPRIGDALTAWLQQKPAAAVVEIADSGVYAEQLNIVLGEKQSLQLRAAEGRRPVLRLLDWQTDLPDSLSVTGAAGSRFILDGILVTGRSVQVQGEMDCLVIRHCTLVPGWGLECDCEPTRPAEPSIELFNTRACLRVEHSIIGSIAVNEENLRGDPISIRMSDSVLDSTSHDREALSGPGCPVAHAVLTIARCTVIGHLQAHAIDLAENCLFNGLVTVGRRQRGCIRFCWVEPGSRTPRRFNCQPDLVDAVVAAGVAKGEISPDQALAVHARERFRVVPRYGTLRYGHPDYCQLASSCASEITRGADDESEMGVFHNLLQPQRAANLRVRLDEYMPAGMDAGVIYVT